MTTEICDDRLGRLLNDLVVASLPDSVRHQLLSIASNSSRARPQVRTSISAKLHELVAELVHDSFGHLAAAGARSGALPSRDVVHRWNDNDLVLTIPEATAESRAIQGQVFGPDASRWLVSIALDDEIICTLPTDAEGSFSIRIAMGTTVTIFLSDDVAAVRCGPISLDINR